MGAILGLACLQPALLASQAAVGLIAWAAAVTGFGFAFGTVVWETMVKQRVRPEHLSRVSATVGSARCAACRSGTRSQARRPISSGWRRCCGSVPRGWHCRRSFSCHCRRFGPCAAARTQTPQQLPSRRRPERVRSRDARAAGPARARRVPARAEPGGGGDAPPGRLAPLGSHLVRLGGRLGASEHGRLPEAPRAPATRSAPLVDSPTEGRLVQPRHALRRCRATRRRSRPHRHRPAFASLPRQPVPQPRERPGQRLDAADAVDPMAKPSP